MATHCCIPFCSSNYKKRKGISIFAVRRPELARTESEKLHRQKLQAIVLRYRDASNKYDRINQLLHKETAGICELHFEKDCFIVYENSAKKLLKCGVVPTLLLPLKYL